MSQHLKKTLLKTAGQHATLTYHRPLGAFTGSVVSALMLSQLLYWHDEDDPWKAVRDEDWKDLLGHDAVSEYILRQRREELEEQGIIETDLRQSEGAPTHHYRLNMDVLIRQWESFTEAENKAGTEDDVETRSNGTPTSPAGDPEEALLSELLALSPSDVTPEVAVEAWNKFANDMREDGYEIPRVRKITDTRETWVQSKKEDLWPDMDELMRRIKRSSHLRGENDRGWTVDFNWIWKYENNAIKVLEGNYDDRDNGSSYETSRKAESGAKSSGYDSVGY